MDGIAHMLQGSTKLLVGQELCGQNVVGHASLPHHQSLAQLVPGVRGGFCPHGAALHQHLGAVGLLRLLERLVPERDSLAGVAGALLLNNAAVAALGLQYLGLEVALQAAQALKEVRMV